jgi:hypothetical protein
MLKPTAIAGRIDMKIELRIAIENSIMTKAIRDTGIKSNEEDHRLMNIAKIAPLILRK